MEVQKKDGDKSQMYNSLKFSERYASGACALWSLRARCAIVAFSFNTAFHSKTEGVAGRVRGYLLVAHLGVLPETTGAKPAERRLGPASLCRAGAAIRNLALSCAGCEEIQRKGMGKHGPLLTQEFVFSIIPSPYVCVCSSDTNGVPHTWTLR